jgi:PAS domain S-box-containing protein
LPGLPIADVIEHYRNCRALVDSALQAGRQIVRLQKAAEQLLSRLRLMDHIAANGDMAFGQAGGPAFGTLRRGSMFIVAQDPTPISSGDGARKGAAASDGVTAQERTAAALRETEWRCRILFEESPNPIYMLDRETLGFVAVNDAALRVYGYTRGQFLAMNLRDIHVSNGPHGFTGAVPDWCLGPLEPTPARHRTRMRGVIGVETVAGLVHLDGRAAYVVFVQETAFAG